MIKTIEIAPDIIAYELAKHLKIDKYDWCYVEEDFYSPFSYVEIDIEKLAKSIKEYLNR